MAEEKKTYDLVVSSGEESEDSGPEDAGVLEVKNAGKKGKEAKERKAARDEISKRSRMWQTVGSSDEEDTREAARGHERRHKNGSGDASGADTDSESDSDSKSSSDSESDSNTDSGTDRKKSKKRKKSKRSKHKKSKKKKHKKHKKSSKSSKKKKKKRKRDDSTSDSDSDSSRDGDGRGSKKKGKNQGAVNQDEYGKYGIISTAERFAKSREFEAWCGEVKKAPGVVNGPQWEVMEYFKEYMEDYNTATLPHAKYYNFERWEAQEYARKKAKDAKKAKRTRTDFDDEAVLQESRLQTKQEKAAARLKETLMLMDKDKVAEMKHQRLLVAELQNAYKVGNTEKVKQIEKRSDPEIQDARWGKYNAPDLNQYNPSL